MAEATVAFALGVETVTSVLEIDLGVAETPIVGNFAGLIPAGTVARIVGDVNLTGDLIVEGTLTGIDTFTLEGNRFQLLFQNGGKPDLAGVQKSGWVRWGDPVVGWQVGDRLAVAPTKTAVYTPSETIWQGSWAATARPANSPDVTLVGGSVAKPEVANLSQTIVLQNLRRTHFHDGAGVANLKWLKVLNSGTTGVLAEYPIHFHLAGETPRGSLLEGVVVEGGKNHAFVTHGSHGVTLKDCVAYNTVTLPYWWDPPVNNNIQVDPNESHDIVYDHCLAMLVTENLLRQDGFHLGRGVGNRCVNSVATCIQGGTQSAGFQWPEVGIGNWIFQDCVSHNNKALGIFAWQNSPLPHVIEDFVAYRNGRAGILHGAYLNFYLYRNITLSNNPIALIGHALSSVTTEFPNANLTFEDVLTDGPLLISSHQQPSSRPVFYCRCTFTAVTYNEVQAGSFSYIIHEDSGLVPSDFTFTIVQPQSVIEIKEAGVLEHRKVAPGGWA